MEKIIYLIRHGKQERNNILELANKDIPLSEEGIQELIKISQNKIFGDIEKIYCSEYLRAKSTAEIIAKRNNIDIVIDSNLNERTLGDLNQRKDIVSKYNMSYTSYQILNKSFASKNGENFNISQARFIKSFDKILNSKENNIAIVSHGAILKFFLLKFCEFDSKNYNIVFNNNIVAYEKLKSPEIIKLTFENDILKCIKNITDDLIM